MDRKAQAAMEFLMTYGWAIIVVLVAIGALAYFGVLSPTKFLPESCVIAPGFSCDDFKVATDGTATVIIRIGAKADITSVSLSIGNETGTCDPTSVKVGETTECTVDVADGAAGDRFKDSITLSYTEKGGFDHSKTGTIVTRYE